MTISYCPAGECHGSGGIIPVVGRTDSRYRHVTLPALDVCGDCSASKMLLMGTDARIGRQCFGQGCVSAVRGVARGNLGRGIRLECSNPGTMALLALVGSCGGAPNRRTLAVADDLTAGHLVSGCGNSRIGADKSLRLVKEDVGGTV